MRKLFAALFALVPALLMAQPAPISISGSLTFTNSAGTIVPVMNRPVAINNLRVTNLVIVLAATNQSQTGPGFWAIDAGGGQGLGTFGSGLNFDPVTKILTSNGGAGNASAAGTNISIVTNGFVLTISGITDTNAVRGLISAVTNGAILNLSNYVLTVSQNATNEALLLSQNGTNESRADALGATNYTITATNSIAAYARTLSLNDTNNQAGATNYTIQATNDIASYARTLSLNDTNNQAGSTNYTITATNSIAAYARSLTNVIYAPAVTGLLPNTVTPTNTLNQSGVVTPGSGNLNKFWGTDGSGNPGWQNGSGGGGAATNAITTVLSNSVPIVTGATNLIFTNLASSTVQFTVLSSTPGAPAVAGMVTGNLTNNTIGAAASATNDQNGNNLFTQFQNGTNQSLKIGANDTNNDIVMATGITNGAINNLSNYVFTLSQNGTNEARNDALGATNYTITATNSLASYARTLSLNDTNYTITATNTISANQITNTINHQVGTNVFSAQAMTYFASLAGGGGTAGSNIFVTAGVVDLNNAMTNIQSIGFNSGGTIGGAANPPTDILTMSNSFTVAYAMELRTNSSPLFGGAVVAPGITNTGFAAVGIVTNDAAGKLYTTFPLPKGSSDLTYATNNDAAVTNYAALVVGVGSTNYAALVVGVGATNEALRQATSITNGAINNLSNYVFTLSQNGTNESVLLTQNTTNEARADALGATNFTITATNTISANQLTNTLNHQVATNVFGASAMTYFASLAAGGGSQTPWTGNINGASNTLSNVSSILSMSYNYQSVVYAATNGSISNDGLSTNTPWPYLYAITNAPKGATVILMPGVYSNTAILSLSSQVGIYIKSQIKWAAQLESIPGNHTFYVAPGISNGTLDGLQIGPSYQDCVKLDLSVGWTLRNCWIHDAAHGDPAWATNSSGAYTGNGISAYGNRNLLVENCLVETNGAYVVAGVPQNHGIYTSGTNDVIRNSVFRYNLGFGIQIYDGTSGKGSADFQVYNDLVYNNGTYANLYRSCMVVYCSDAGEYAFTNYVFGNTLINGGDGSFPVINASEGGYVQLTNNILVSPYAGTILGQLGATINADYNVSTNALGATGTVLGSHNIVSTYTAIAFDSPTKGLYWITPGSTARGSSLSTCFGPIDFWGNTQVSVNHQGAFGYHSDLAGDFRTLDPSPSNGANYWMPYGVSQTNYFGNVIGNSSGSTNDDKGNVIATQFANGTNQVLLRVGQATNEVTRQVLNATNTPAVVFAASNDGNGNSIFTQLQNTTNQVILRTGQTTNEVTRQVLNATNSPAVVFESGIALTSFTASNLTAYVYATNSSGTTTLVCDTGLAYYTNLAAGNVTIAAITINSNAAFGSCVYFATNTSGADRTITFPTGVRGPVGSGNPPVFYATNNTLTRIAVEHYGTFLIDAIPMTLAP